MNDFDDLLSEDIPESAMEGAATDFVDSVHFAPAATKALSEPQSHPAWTDDEIDAMEENLSEEDVKRALAGRTPEMRTLIGAEPTDA